MVTKWVASSGNRFQAVFIAYGFCVKGFLEGGIPILYVDGCHLSSPYKEVTIVSKRHNSIKGVVQAVLGGDQHVFCYRHVKENYNAEFLKIAREKRRTSRQTKEVALKLLDSIAYARLDRDYDHSMEKLMGFCLKLGYWLQTNRDVEHWAQSKFFYKRWDNITTNNAESFNAWLVGKRKHNIAVLIHEHREKLAKKIYNSKQAMRNWSNGVGPNIKEKLMDHVIRSERIDVQDYGMSNFRVRWENLDVRILQVNQLTCKCIDSGCESRSRRALAYVRVHVIQVKNNTLNDLIVVVNVIVSLANCLILHAKR
ncbi:uncharacterized protein LOC114711682 [Neltuma alba]|uniref:uncharacterized protein LOC114711682 n=1 Tax=Neltuma alba TaxID=207710 RepID=UPI0010A4D775|nr:uncharacterized protein LOC114711682 [Prosopis alba]